MSLRVSGNGEYRDPSKLEVKPQDMMTDKSVQKLDGESVAKLQPNNGAATQEDTEQEEDKANRNRLKSAVERANEKMKNVKTRCEFSYHEETKRISIKVIDKDSQKVIREIPPEETLEMVEKMWELAGILVDERR